MWVVSSGEENKALPSLSVSVVVAPVGGILVVPWVADDSGTVLVMGGLAPVAPVAVVGGLVPVASVPVMVESALSAFLALMAYSLSFL